MDENKNTCDCGKGKATITVRTGAPELPYLHICRECYATQWPESARVS